MVDEGAMMGHARDVNIDGSGAGSTVMMLATDPARTTSPPLSSTIHASDGMTIKLCRTEC